MIQYAIVCFFALLAVLGLVLVDLGEPRIVKYDCGMAVWHPDIPVKAKEECRKLRSNNANRTSQ